MKWAYYNDIDKNCCAWIRQLIKDGLITDGEVDDRSIADVRPEDVRDFRRVHFFAGIGGWDYALQLAGWPDDRPVWTASCPCQPFSAAGRQMGSADSRHLFPTFRRLVARCRPSVAIGEQVASELGRKWLARVRLEMATLGYATRASDLCAASVGAPQIRQRLFWMADADSTGLDGIDTLLRPKDNQWGETEIYEVAGCGETPRLGHSHDPRSQGRLLNRDCSSEWSPWSAGVAVSGNDGITRRVEPGIPPLAYGLPGRVALIRGSGNAIVPQAAAAFIRAAVADGSDRGLTEIVID